MREKLIELIQTAVGGCATYWAGLIADHLIANGVTIPVRCKDCKHCGVLEHNGKRYCKEPMGCLGCIPTEADNFCSYGERRTE